MKKTRTKSVAGAGDELLPEYRFNYRKAKPNRFAGAAKSGTRTIVLDPDVAAVFTSEYDVNGVLRALMQAMPNRAGRR